MSSVAGRFSARYVWNNGAPTLAEGSDGLVAAPGNPGGTSSGQIQIAFDAALSALLIHATANAGAASWKVTVQNSSGLLKVLDDAGAAVNFGSTTGLVIVTGRYEATA